MSVSARSWRVRVAWISGLAVGVVLLFLAFLRLSQTAAVNSDGASNALQAWDMLHGNLLLHGWWLSDVSFYTTELPQYMLVELARGLGADTVHLAAAMTYTLLVVLAGLLAKGRATGRTALVRVLISCGIMIAPQLGGGVNVLLLSPDHVGTGVPLLLIWLVIDRARPGWYVPVLAGAMLAWVQVADSLALLIGVLPLASVCAVRAAARLTASLIRRLSGSPDRAHTGSRAPAWYEPGLAVAALISVPVAAEAVRLIREHGGYFVTAPGFKLAGTATLAAHLKPAVWDVLELFGARLTGARPGAELFFATVHVAGVALVAVALLIALWRFFRADELIVPVLAIAIIANLAGYLVTNQQVDSWSAREIAAVLPFGAVLAGRLLAGPLSAAPRLNRSRLTRSRLAGQAARSVWLMLLAAGSACALCYAAALGYSAARPPVPGVTQNLAGWLTRHHLRAGLAGYWQANSTTLASSARVLVISVDARHRLLGPGRKWERNRSWYDPALHDATFVVTVIGPQTSTGAPARTGTTVRTARSARPTRLPVLAQAARREFGRPAQVYHYRRYLVQVWTDNLLKTLGHKSQRHRKARRHPKASL